MARSMARRRLGRVGILVSKNLSCKLWDGILDSAFEVVHWFKALRRQFWEKWEIQLLVLSSRLSVLGILMKCTEG
jgi:hypothetical protein